MKRRSVATATTTRPIEFWPQRFFLLVVRETPSVSLSLPRSPPQSKPRPLCLPVTPGVEIVELHPSLLEPRGRETRLDAAHTLRFCRFLNASSSRHCVVRAGVGKPRQVHFVVRSHVRGDEAAVVELLVRWRLLCLQLSPADALAPFQHTPLRLGRLDRIEASLAGIARGVASELLFPSAAFLSNLIDETDDESDDHGDDQRCFTRVTARLLLFAGPIDDDRSEVTCTAATTVKLSARSEPERPPTVDEPTEPGAGSTIVDENNDHDHDDDQNDHEHDTGSTSLRRLCVAQLAPQLKQLGVAMVVKLNVAPAYDDQLIVRSGIDHLDLSGRSDRDGIDRTVVARFLESCENSPPQSVVAVHSTTGLGRAALCVASYLVKHAQFRAIEAVGWLRFCCPGAIAPWHEQQLQAMERALWHDGDAFRRRLADDPHSSRSGRLSLSLDDLALGSLVASSSSSARLAPQISIGNIALGRDSLLGTKDKASRVSADHHDHDRGLLASSLSPISTAQVVPLQRGAGGSFRALVASDAVLGAQTKRRPLTQGAVGRRRLLDHHQHHQHGDYATLHRFLHQSSSPVVVAASSVAATARSASTAATYSGSHVTPQRSAATAPDRSCLAAGSSSSSSSASTTSTRGSRQQLQASPTEPSFD